MFNAAPVRPLVLIPARLGSTRLPRKALLDLEGQPMIVRTMRQALKVKELAGVIVLTDAQEISRAVEDAGGVALLMTLPCSSGSERVGLTLRDERLKAELKRRCPSWDERWVINVQGDEPLLPPASLKKLCCSLPDWEQREVAFVTLGSPLHQLSSEQRALCLSRREVVKVVVDQRAEALYFSRAGVGGDEAWLHVGVYAYHAQEWALLCSPRSPLAQAEDLEQLTWLEHQRRVGVVEVPPHPKGVDTLGDLERVRAALRRA